MPGARVRTATLRDLDLLVRHRRGMWVDIGHFSQAQLDEGDRVYRRWARSRLGSGTLVGFVLETPRGEAVASGCLWLMPRQPRPMRRRPIVPYLLSMFTEPAHRGKGYATRIVRAAVQWARDEGYDAITLHASDYGASVYRRAGFRPSREMRLRFPGADRVRWKARPRKRGSKV